MSPPLDFESIHVTCFGPWNLSGFTLTKYRKIPVWLDWYSYTSVTAIRTFLGFFFWSQEKDEDYIKQSRATSPET